MSFPTQITFHGMERVPELEGRIRDRIQRLVRLCSEINGCRVVVEAPDHVNIVLRLPRTVLAVSKGDLKNGEQLDLSVAVNQAFDAAERALREVERRVERV